MLGEGIHCSQWAAAKNDAPIAGSAYTWAEEGYPLVTPKSPMAIDSCSKALTGMAVVHFFAPDGNKTLLSQSIFGLLGTALQPVNQTDAANTTLDDCLYMTTGFAEWINGAEPTVAKYAQPDGLPPTLPGDQTKFFAAYPQSLWDESPATASPRYEGAGTRLMSELLGLTRASSTSNYALAMRNWWGVNEEQAYFPFPTPAQCLGQGTPPQHARRPRTESVRRRRPTFRDPHGRQYNDLGVQRRLDWLGFVHGVLLRTNSSGRYDSGRADLGDRADIQSAPVPIRWAHLVVDSGPQSQPAPELHL